MKLRAALLAVSLLGAGACVHMKGPSPAQAARPSPTQAQTRANTVPTDNAPTDTWAGTNAMASPSDNNTATGGSGRER